MVDTPPSRSALDFLDAPARLGRFLDGRMLRLLLAPARAGGRSVFSLVTASFGVFSRVVQKVLGAQLLTDLSGFVAALDSMFGGFRQRAEQTYRILQDPETAFLRGRGAGAGRGPGGGLLRPPARRRADAAGRAGAQPGAPHRRCRSSTAEEQPGGGRPSWPRRASQAPPPRRCAVHAHCRSQADRETVMAGVHRPVPARAHGAPMPAQPADVHDIDGLRTDRLGDQPAVTSTLLLVAQRGFEHLAPARHLRVPPQQRAPLALGHATPDTELDAVVERVGQALVPHRAATADSLRDVLLGALHEQRVRVSVLACRQSRPVSDHAHLSTSPLAVRYRSLPHQSEFPTSSRQVLAPGHPPLPFPRETADACDPRRTIMLRSRLITQRCQINTSQRDTLRLPRN